MGKVQQIHRPIRKDEFTVVVSTNAAKIGWRDLCATQRNLMAQAWDFLTENPHRHTPTNYPLNGDLATICRDGKEFPRWQYKPSRGNGARIWYYVDGQKVCIEKVFTHHPKETL